MTKPLEEKLNKLIIEEVITTSHYTGLNFWLKETLNGLILPKHLLIMKNKS
jgi:hypothetical protein